LSSARGRRRRLRLRRLCGEAGGDAVTAEGAVRVAADENLIVAILMVEIPETLKINFFKLAVNYSGITCLGCCGYGTSNGKCS
jgi:polyribonucleotide nucleotidyltransferase